METPKTTQTGAVLVPVQLSAFPLFGGSGVPQAQSVSRESNDDDLAAWQPFFAPATPQSPHAAALASYPGVNLAMLPPAPLTSALFAANPLLSPRGFITEGMLEAMALDVSNSTRTLIPRLNLDAIGLHASQLPPTNANTSSGGFAVPTTPPGPPSSGRISRLASPSGSLSSSGARSNAQNSLAASGPTSPRAQRIQSTYSARESSLMDETPLSPVSSARGKRRRSIYDDDQDAELEDAAAAFVGTYVPTVSSARQKKKRALAEHAALQSSQ